MVYIGTKAERSLRAKYLIQIMIGKKNTRLEGNKLDVCNKRKAKHVWNQQLYDPQR